MEIQEKERAPGVLGRLAAEGKLLDGEKRLGPCQVRSRTDRPCPHPAVVEIRGVPFCGRCAREQQVYFTIGDLTQEARGAREQQSKRGLRNEPLGGTPEGARWELVGRIVRARRLRGGARRCLTVT